MDLKKIIKELTAEREAMDATILAIEHLLSVQGGEKKRGRPPKWLNAARKKAKKIAGPNDA